MIVCAGESEVFDFATPIGIGLIESSINLTKLILEKKPISLEFIGSAGSYGNHKIFDILTSTLATNIEIGFLEDKCYSPIANHIVPRETLNVVNSSNYITTDEISSKKLLQLGLELENMEFFAITSVAKKFNLSVKGIFIVTNYCNKNAHNDFIKNHKKAKELLTNYIKERK